MLNKPTKNIQKEISLHQIFTSQSTASNYGLGLPKENVTHITSYLEPPDLLAVGRVCSSLCEHIRDDHTWHRAFALNYLGILPEGELDDSLVFRRTQSTWRKEYIARYHLLRRWVRAHTSTVTHIPVHSSISSIHLLSTNALLTSSLLYGIVSRSVPSTGKVLRGYLSPTGTGLGTGNPNAEFAPNISASDMTSDGGTVKIAWGFRSGEVAVTTAAKAMESVRPAAKIMRCLTGEAHDGEVASIIWDASVVVTGGKDGRVKVWDSQTVRCLWPSERKTQETGVPEVFVKVASAFSRGVVAAATESGDLFVWEGCRPMEEYVVKETKISCPLPPPSSRPILSLTISSPRFVFLAYQGNTEFFRVDIPSGELTTFSGFAPVTSVLTVTTTKDGGSSFILVGDQLGSISLFNPLADGTVPVRSFLAHTDFTAVTAVAWDGATLISGSGKGVTTVFDAYTFQPLRIFPSPISRGGMREVRQIQVSQEKDMFVAAIGDRVMSCKVAGLPKNGGVRGRNVAGVVKGRKDKVVNSKGYDKLLLKETVSDSLHELGTESSSRQKRFGREREQRENLQRLGLSETEALEYVLMLSREEHAKQVEEGVFEGDFDDAPSSASSSAGRVSPSRKTSTPLPLLSTSSTRKSRNPSPPASYKVSPSLSNTKVQVSPKYQPEPKEAGPSSMSTSVSPIAIPPGSHFPSISPPKAAKGSTSNSRSVWGSSPRSWKSGSGGGRISRTPSGSEDEDLRLAIELSLAEARATGMQ